MNAWGALAFDACLWSCRDKAWSAYHTKVEVGPPFEQAAGEWRNAVAAV
jgi:hypothetical protein